MAKSPRRLPKSQRPDGDRRIRQAEAMARKLYLLRRLLEAGPWTLPKLAQQLAADLGIKSLSTQTIHRDLRVLRLAGIPVRFCRLRGSYLIEPTAQSGLAPMQKFLDTWSATKPPPS